MTASRFNRKSAAAITSLATLAALVMPLIGVAQATHPGPHSSRQLRITPEVDLNQVGTEHTLTAEIDLDADANGVDVDFEIVCHTSDFGAPLEGTNTGPNNNANSNTHFPFRPTPGVGGPGAFLGVSDNDGAGPGADDARGACAPSGNMVVPGQDAPDQEPIYDSLSGETAYNGGVPDEADTDNNPDLTCRIDPGQRTCTVSYTREDQGTDEIEA